ncbi:MAG: alanine dehydrogenase [Desulfovibrionaceae bacterium]|nr:alanine dehydrogenase [Desulfovibrionaceae bacterium]MBF0514024.1 alanine dehydrogenase [Desulfovibrionaceae bacterium]
MIVGIPKEIKAQENRVSMTPGAVSALVRAGNEVVVQRGAGTGSGLPDAEYKAAGARLASAEAAWKADLVVKVKEPVAKEYRYLRPGLTLFTYLHLAACEELAHELMRAKVTAIAYETVTGPDGHLPLLTPMSEVAGRMAPQVGAFYLEKWLGGRGILLGGVPGVAPGSVVILGGGVVGVNAAKIALGLGAQVTILDISHNRLQYLDDVFGGRLVTLASNEPNIRKAASFADLLIGAVLITGAKAPRLITREILSTMKQGSVIVDVSVDQGGCVETIKPTTHKDPVYTVDGVLHYGVANMPGAVPRTSTFALVNQTLPYALRLAKDGLSALRADPGLAQGLSTHQGALTCPAAGEALGVKAVTPEAALR